MEKVIASEKVKLTLVQQEYQKYKAAKLIIGKVDIELLNRLRSDTLYADLFKKIHLNSAQRGDGGEGGKISFEFSAFTKKWKAQ